MLRVIFPDYCQAEHNWIADVVFRQFLGLECEVSVGNDEKTRITASGKVLELPDTFLNSANTNWLSSTTFPREPLQLWKVGQSGLTAKLAAPTVPVLYGEPGFSLRSNDYATLNLDIFGSIFFMLSRYEEAANPERDAHARFPGKASLAYRAGFLARPLADEYVEILWAAIQSLWPTLQRKKHDPRILVSCDVDLPFDPACTSLYRLGSRIIGRSWREKSLDAVPSTIMCHWAVRRGDYTRDPYYQALIWMMDVNEKAGNQVTFNFIPEKTDTEMDNAGSLDEPNRRSLLRTIHNRGHLIGFHPGYNTYKHPETFAKSITTLRRVMEQERIAQAELGGRQHYLRWDVLTTGALWDAHHLSYDSTLSYADMSGFRCGTCHEYLMYDLANRKPLQLRERPLVVMESSVIDKLYMGLGLSAEALELMQSYKRTCQQFGGDFTLLWHNSYFESPLHKEMYNELIKQ